MGGAQFYVTGGTLSTQARCYLERQADRDLYEGLLAGEFCYVLTTRQMGKSSLMVRTCLRLREAGAYVVAIDMTALGSNVTAEQWYEGILLQIGQRVHLEEELERFWESRRSIGPCQRLFAALSEVLQPSLEQRVAQALPPGEQLAGLSTELPHWRSLIVFVDEIDMVRSLPFSTDEFFGAIRERYNSRAWSSQGSGLTFCLLGVATPSQLIEDPRVSPFNVGRRIELEDFTRQELVPLGGGLGPTKGLGQILDRIYAWTHGHPYLTQKLCRAVAEAHAGVLGGGVGRRVDRVCRELFLTPKARTQDENLQFVRDRVLRSDLDRLAILNVYGDILRGQRVATDTRDPVVNLLLLSGLGRSEQGYLRVRNRIYATAFNLRWVHHELPGMAARVQRKAYWRGIRRAAWVSTLVVFVLGAFALQQIRLASSEKQRSARLAQLDAFFELSEDLFALASTEGRFLKVNRKWEEVLGYSREQLCRVPYADFVHPDDLAGTATQTRVLANGQPVINFTNRYRRRYGTYVTLVWRATTDPASGVICATARPVADE